MKKIIFWLILIINLIIASSSYSVGKEYIEPGDCIEYYKSINGSKVEVCSRSCPEVPDMICECPSFTCPNINCDPSYTIDCKPPNVNTTIENKFSIFGGSKKDNNEATVETTPNRNNDDIKWFGLNWYVWIIIIGAIFLAWRYNWFRYLSAGGKEIKESYKKDYTHTKEQAKEKIDDWKERFKEK